MIQTLYFDSQPYTYIYIYILVGGIPTPLKNDGVRQWKNYPIYEMENKQCLKPSTSTILY